ncbi:MAG: quinohemoprotein amine dehydrogenase subunit beta [Thauera sp.]|jgi:quinohemoprotein amine dehydrogenase beta subunit
MTLIRRISTLGAVGLLGAAALLAGCATPAHKVAATDAEYLLTVSRPGLLHVIDMKTDRIARSCEVPGKFGSGALVPSPDGRHAFVLGNLWEDVYGFELETCKLVFSARQSVADVTVKTVQSLAVSADGSELYTVQNPVRRGADRFEVMQPRLAVYRIADGLDAKPVRSFPVKRRITKIAATVGGEVILGGADVEAIDVRSGALRTVSALASWDRGPRWLTPDAFAMHSQGEHLNEYVMPYVTAKFADDKQDMASAEWWWGMSRVDLDTGKAETREIFPFEFVIFSLLADPRDRNILYGAFNTLSKHDIARKQTLKVVELDHTYYSVQISRDASRLYVGGAGSTISIHDSGTLEKIGSIQLPGDMSTADVRVAYKRR